MAALEFQAVLRTHAGRALFTTPPRDTFAEAELDIPKAAGWKHRKPTDVAAIERTDGQPIVKVVSTCTTCGGTGQQDDGETRFPCKSCHCRECGEKLSKQFGWCVNLKCDASKAVA